VPKQDATRELNKQGIVIRQWIVIRDKAMVKITKISTIMDLYKKLGCTLKRVKSDIQVDLGQLTLVDTATIQLLWVFARSITEKGYQVSWIDVPQALEDLSANTGLKKTFS